MAPYWYALFSIQWSETVLSQYYLPEVQEQYMFMIVNDLYHLIPIYLLDIYSTVNASLAFVPPKLIPTSDGKWCTPQHSYKDLWDLVGKGYETPRDAIVMYPMIVKFASTQNVTAHQFTQTTSWYLQNGLVGNYDFPVFLTDCKAHLQTTNVLPFSVSSIGHTIGHAMLTACSMLRDLALQVLDEALDLYYVLRDHYPIDQYLLLVIIFIFSRFTLVNSFILALFTLLGFKFIINQ
uniref:Putative secreted protein n=1 Tax=Phlebotomus kandelakii TaxID=1109342 RepID=A0A6B2ECP8_9DIPT